MYIQYITNYTNMNKKHLREVFLIELQNFLTATVPSGSIVTAREIKLWVKGLEESHPIYTSYYSYSGCIDVEKALTGIVRHIKYLPGYYREVVTHKRVGTGLKVKYVKMHKNKVKIN